MSLEPFKVGTFPQRISWEGNGIYREYTFHEPTVIVNTDINRLNARVFASFGRPPDTDFETYRAILGNLWIPHPGSWWIKYELMAGVILVDKSWTAYPCHSYDEARSRFTRRPAWNFEGAIAVGVASTAVLPQNSHRNYLFLQNNSANDIYVDDDTTAISGEGWALLGRGANKEWDAGRGEVVPCNAISAIASAAASSLIVKEAE